MRRPKLASFGNGSTHVAYSGPHAKLAGSFDSPVVPSLRSSPAKGPPRAPPVGTFRRHHYFFFGRKDSGATTGTTNNTKREPRKSISRKGGFPKPWLLKKRISTPKSAKNLDFCQKMPILTPFWDPVWAPENPEKTRIFRRCPYRPLISYKIGGIPT